MSEGAHAFDNGGGALTLCERAGAGVVRSVRVAPLAGDAARGWRAWLGDWDELTLTLEARPHRHFGMSRTLMLFMPRS